MLSLNTKEIYLVHSIESLDLLGVLSSLLLCILFLIFITIDWYIYLSETLADDPSGAEVGHVLALDQARPVNLPSLPIMIDAGAASIGGKAIRIPYESLDPIGARLRQAYSTWFNIGVPMERVRGVNGITYIGLRFVRADDTSQHIKNGPASILRRAVSGERPRSEKSLFITNFEGRQGFWKPKPPSTYLRVGNLHTAGGIRIVTSLFYLILWIYIF